MSPENMDAVDKRQQDEINAEAQRNDKQQRQIDGLRWKSFWMMVVLAINTLAAVAQIAECWKIWQMAGRQ